MFFLFVRIVYVNRVTSFACKTNYHLYAGVFFCLTNKMQLLRWIKSPPWRHTKRSSRLLLTREQAKAYAIMITPPATGRPIMFTSFIRYVVDRGVYVLLIVCTVFVFGPGTTQASWIEGVHHTVQSGENLSVIASKYRTSVKELMRLNGLANPDRVRVGQRLTVFDPEDAGRLQWH